jgi:hypothetical protein
MSNTKKQDVREAFRKAWFDRLAREAAGLDFGDAEDRATFRGRVAAALANLKFAAAQDLLDMLSDGSVTVRNRTNAARAIAAEWMCRRNTDR